MVRPASARDEKREQRRRDKEQERADLEAEGKRRDREQARRDALARGEPTPRMAAAQRLVEHLRRLEHGRWTASGVEDSVMVDGARSWRAVERAAAVAVTEALAPLLAEAKAEFAAAELERDEILRRGR
ncbi:MAG: hypothetical protein ACXWWX_03405 [Actinomycetota bacterium]